MESPQQPRPSCLPIRVQHGNTRTDQRTSSCVGCFGRATAAHACTKERDFSVTNSSSTIWRGRGEGCFPNVSVPVRRKARLPPGGCSYAARWRSCLHQSPPAPTSVPITRRHPVIGGRNLRSFLPRKYHLKSSLKSGTCRTRLVAVKHSNSHCLSPFSPVTGARECVRSSNTPMMNLWFSKNQTLSPSPFVRRKSAVLRPGFAGTDLL